MFSKPSRPTLEPTDYRIQRVPGFFLQGKAAGGEVTHSYNIEIKMVGAVLLLPLHAFFLAWTGTALPFMKF